MTILAMEASGQVAGCAIYQDGKILGEYNTDFKKTHSQTLMPMLDTVVKMVGLDLSSIDAIAITSGPGSFTGLRIGAATAKGIGLALEKPMIGIPTLDSLAFNLFGTDALVCPLIDARRSQVFTGIYEETEEPICLRESCAVPIEEILQDLNERGRAVIFLGDGAPVYRSVIEETLKVPFSFAPAHMAVQRAASTAVLAAKKLEKEGESCLVSSDEFRPEYLRKSQAERQREQAEKEGAMDALASGTLVKKERAEQAKRSKDGQL